MLLMILVGMTYFLLQSSGSNWAWVRCHLAAAVGKFMGIELPSVLLHHGDLVGELGFWPVDGLAFGSSYHPSFPFMVPGAHGVGDLGAMGEAGAKSPTKPCGRMASGAWANSEAHSLCSVLYCLVL